MRDSVKNLLLIIHEENTKEIMSVKESVYLIQISLDFHKL